MAQYRKKPVVIEAKQWFQVGDVSQDIRYFADPRNQTLEGVAFATQRCQHCQYGKGKHGWINTLEGGHIVCPGDWIITGIKGEHYPCKPDIFEATYEPVEEKDVL